MRAVAIDLRTPLSLRDAFGFPLQSRVARGEVVWGAVLLLVPVVGWLLNMGHRIEMVRRMQRGESAWPAWGDYPRLMKYGTVTFLGMAAYHAPAVMCGAAAWWYGVGWLWWVAGALWVLATVLVPGYMTHYCHSLDPWEIFNPVRALSHVAEGGRRYWKAWGVALAALVCSFLGLLFLGVGFLVTSVWFWQVAGFSFATVFSEKFGLVRAGTDADEIGSSDGDVSCAL